MSILHYPGMVLALLLLSFFGGMIALYVRLPHALWRLAVALARHSYRHARRLWLVARHVRAATHGALRPPARSALRVTFPAAPWRNRPRLVVLVADPSARRARADQLRDALADLLRARSRPLPATLTIEVASEARRHGIAYVAYLDRGRATGAIRIRLAAFAPDGEAIGVDAQHTHLADLLPYLGVDPAATFVGLPAADPSSPTFIGSPMHPIPEARQAETVRHGGAIVEPPPASPSAPCSLVGGATRPPVDLGHPEPAPIGILGDADPDIPYGDHDAPAA